MGCCRPHDLRHLLAGAGGGLDRGAHRERVIRVARRRVTVRTNERPEEATLGHVARVTKRRETEKLRKYGEKAAVPGLPPGWPERAQRDPPRGRAGLRPEQDVRDTGWQGREVH